MSSELLGLTDADVRADLMKALALPVQDGGREGGSDLSLSHDALLAELLQSCNREGGQSAWSRKHDIAQSTISQVLKGQREPTETIINALGYTQITRYVRMVARAAA